MKQLLNVTSELRIKDLLLSDIDYCSHSYGFKNS